MGCTYNNFKGECSLFDEGTDRPGYDDKGFCICDEDPDPAYLCGDYEDEETTTNWN